MSARRHAFVIGTGIAGLATAEILSRNGYSLTLLDSSPELGGDASRNTQNWFHSGWLYAALDNDAAMNGCAAALRLFHPVYDAVLGRSVVNVLPTPNGVDYPTSATGWFDAERMHYLYAAQGAELSGPERIVWQHRLNEIALPRLAALGYRTRSAPANELEALMSHWEGHGNGSAAYRTIVSTDARLHTCRILDTLIGLLGTRTEVVLGATCRLVRSGARSVVHVDGEAHSPDLVVLATGAGTPRFLRQIGNVEEAAKFTTIQSPVVVLDRALPLPNFIRFTPKLAHTINHVKVATTGGAERSTIGSYDSFARGRAPAIDAFAERVCARLDVPTAWVAGSYYGTKTEYTDGHARRYNHAVGQVNDNTWFAIAGKFSQFPLLVHDFAARHGLSLDVRNETRGTLARAAGSTSVERVANARRAARSA